MFSGCRREPQGGVPICARVVSTLHCCALVFFRCGGLRCSRWPGCPDCGILRALRARTPHPGSRSFHHRPPSFFFQYCVHFVLGWDAQGLQRFFPRSSMHLCVSLKVTMVVFTETCVEVHRCSLFFGICVHVIISLPLHAHARTCTKVPTT